MLKINKNNENLIFLLNVKKFRSTIIKSKNKFRNYKSISSKLGSLKLAIGQHVNSPKLYHYRRIKD
jgi:hypothetical protein